MFHKILGSFRQQIQEYLDKAITLRSENPRRREAEKIVNMQPAIAIRPLVLSYIKEIVDADRTINTTLDLFDTIIYSILKRDIKKTRGQKNLEEKITQWWKASSLEALYMYRKNKLTITDTELYEILPSNIDKEFKHRSLLTRYGNEYHFSHKSFYEYFMAYRFFLDYEEIEQVYGMDFALKLFDELYDSYCNKQIVRFANLQKTPRYSVAASLYNIGNGLYRINHFTQADPKYNEALTIFRQLAVQNPDAYLPDVAETMNNLAVLFYSTNRHQEAKKEFNEALTIRRQLADQNPDAYLPELSDTLNNLALLHSVTNRYQEAENKYNEALNILRQLADNNPDAYLSKVADTLNNLAILHQDTNRHQEAEKEYNEALSIRRQLADSNPDAHLPYVADTLNNLALLHSFINRHQEAKAEYNEALTIRLQLADKNPDAYLPYIAHTLYNIALLHIDQENLPAAEAAALESLEKYRIMAEKSPAAFNKYVIIAEDKLEEIRQKMKKNK